MQRRRGLDRDPLVDGSKSDSKSDPHPTESRTILRSGAAGSAPLRFKIWNTIGPRTDHDRTTNRPRTTAANEHETVAESGSARLQTGCPPRATTMANHDGRNRTPPMTRRRFFELGLEGSAP